MTLLLFNLALICINYPKGEIITLKYYCFQPSLVNDIKDPCFKIWVKLKINEITTKKNPPNKQRKID